MTRQLTKKDKRTAVIGAVAVGAILLYAYGLDPFFTHWGSVRRQLGAERAKLQRLGLGDEAAGLAKRKGLLKVVPAFEMPHVQDEQRLIFKKKCNEQFNKAGVKVKTMQYGTRAKLDAESGFHLLKLDCKATGKFDQAAELLAVLNTNPHLVTIEAMQLKVDPKKRQEVQMDLTLSSFAE